MSINFQVKQIGRYWRVVGLAGKLFPEQHNSRQQALNQLKVELERVLTERKLMPLVKAFESVTKEVDHGKEDAEGQGQRREGLLTQPPPKRKKKKLKRPSSIILDKHGLR